MRGYSESQGGVTQTVFDADKQAFREMPVPHPFETVAAQASASAETTAVPESAPAVVAPAEPKFEKARASPSMPRRPGIGWATTIQPTPPT